MRKIILLSLMILISDYSVNATTVSQRWVKTLADSSLLGGVYSIIQTSDGGYLLGGFVDFVGENDKDAWALKLDSNGNKIWQKKYGGSDSDVIYAFQETLDGGYVMAGTSYSFSSSFTKTDMWIFKLDNIGNITWQKTYGGSHSETAYAIQQTTDEGYIVAGDTHSFGTGGSDAWVLKLDSDGDVLWQKTYSLNNDVERLRSIQQTTDGGYIVVGDTGDFAIYDTDIWILKLDALGNITWQKTFGGSSLDSAYAVQQTEDGGYIIVGSLGGAWILRLDISGNVIWQKSYSDWAFYHIQQLQDGTYILPGGYFGGGHQYGGIMILDDSGNVIWQKTYDGPGGTGEALVSVQTTKDGGYIAAGMSDFIPWALKIDSSSGEIPGCDIVGTGDTLVSETSVLGEETEGMVYTSAGMMHHTTITPQDIPTGVSEICYYENPADIDGDGLSNNPAGFMSDTFIIGDELLAETDNCPDIPNGPYLGTCIKGNIGNRCIADVACGEGGICSLEQEDSYPPGGNGYGDVCECEGDFECDGDCDGTDAGQFKLDFGRSAFDNPCNNESQCHGDFDCDVDVDGTDAALFKSDFGRSSFNNPCPACEVGDWCVY